ncbi:MAG: hypothetical protein IJ213_08140 [Bacteroidales bacterium]|nr:hypothetical protein [Bacteroidales bacterium]
MGIGKLIVGYGDMVVDKVCWEDVGYYFCLGDKVFGIKKSNRSDDERLLSYYLSLYD